MIRRNEGGRTPPDKGYDTVVSVFDDSMMEAFGGAAGHEYFKVAVIMPSEVQQDGKALHFPVSALLTTLRIAVKSVHWGENSFLRFPQEDEENDKVGIKFDKSYGEPAILAVANKYAIARLAVSGLVPAIFVIDMPTAKIVATARPYHEIGALGSSFGHGDK